MAFQRDKDGSHNVADAVLPRADSGQDVPRWLAVLGAAAGLTLFVALLRYAIDLLGIVSVIILVGFAIRTLSDWLTEGESVSGWAFSALSMGLVGTALVGLWLFNSRDVSANRLEERLPGPVQRTVAWFETRGWGQRVLLPSSGGASNAGSGRSVPGGLDRADAPSGSGSQAPPIAMAAPRALPEPSRPSPSRTRPAQSRPGPGVAEAAPAAPSGDAPPPVSPSEPEVVPAATTVRLTAPSSSVVGRSVRLVAQVEAARAGERVPTGTVVFSAGGVVVGRAPLRRGTALLVTLSLELGDQRLTAAYTGDQWHLPGESAAVLHTVRRQ